LTNHSQLFFLHSTVISQWPSLHRAFDTRIRYYVRIKFVLNI